MPRFVTLHPLRLAGVFCARWLLLLGILAGSGVRAEDQTWSKVVTEHFTILTPGGEALARKWAVELEQFRRGLQNAVPVPVERLRPVTVVLFRSDREMQAFLPLVNGGPAKLGGFFVRANDINTIALSLARDDARTRHVIFHEAVHWHLSAREGIMPLWLTEGLAEVYSTFEITDTKQYAFGAAIDGHVRRLRGEPLLPLAKLVNIGRSSLLYDEDARTNIFYAQSWAFVHYLLFGRDSPGRAAVQRYLELLPSLHSQDDAFFAAFGGDYARLEQQLRRHINHGRYHKYLYERATADIHRNLKATIAARADVELAKGSLLLGARSPADALPHLRRATQLAPQDPRAWELLGHMAVKEKDYDTAREVLTKAASAGSRSYLVYHNLAVSRLPELSRLASLGHALDPSTMDEAAADFRRAIELAPGSIPSYEGLAGLIHGMGTFVPGDLDLLVRGLVQSPGNTMLEAGIAAAELRSGRVTDGRARLERLCANHPVGSEPGIDYARRILARETLQAEMEEINRRIVLNELDAVIAIADGALARPLDPDQRRFMREVRRRMTDFRKIQAAVNLANRGEREAATNQLRELLDSGAESAVITEAERLLREITRIEERHPPTR